MNKPLIIQKNKDIYFYKNICEDDKNIEAYLKKSLMQISYNEKITIYKLDEYSIVSLLMLGEDKLKNLIDFLKENSLNEFPVEIENEVNENINSFKQVSLELGTSEIILRILKGDISSLIDNNKNLKKESTYDKKTNTYKFKLEARKKLEKELIDKDINVKFSNDFIQLNQELNFKSNINLRYYQIEAIESILNSNNGLILMPPGAGKNYLAIKIIEKLKVPTLILCDNICEYWKENFCEQTTVSESDITIIDSKNIQLKSITLCSYTQTMKEEIFEILNNNIWGVIIYDNAHKALTDKTTKVLYLKGNYRYALASTLRRTDGKGKLLQRFLGAKLYNVTYEELVTNLYQKNSRCYLLDIRDYRIDFLNVCERILDAYKSKKILIVSRTKEENKSISDKFAIENLNGSTNKQIRRKLVEKYVEDKTSKLCISNLLEKLPITNIDIMICLSYIGASGIEEIFRLGRLRSTYNKLRQNTTAVLIDVIKDDKDYRSLEGKKEVLNIFGCKYEELGINELMEELSRWI